MSKEIEYCLLVLPRADVHKLSKRAKKQFLMLTNVLRDMDLFRKLMIYVKEQNLNDERLSGVAFVTLAFSITKLLMSKLYEAWKFLGKEQVVSEVGTFSEGLRAQWSAVESVCGTSQNAELFGFVRNKFGFHFDSYEEIESVIEEAMNEVGDLEFWMPTEQSWNDLFASSNTVMLVVLRTKMMELGFVGTEEELIGQLIRLSVDASYALNEFCKGYLTEVVLKGLSFQEVSRIVASVPVLSEVNLPLVVVKD